MGLCRLSSIPAGRWPFPTLSLQSLRRCLDPYPAMPFWCICSFLPRRLRLHVADTRFAHGSFPAMQLQQGVSFEAAVIRLTFRLLRLLDSLVAPTFITKVAEPFTPRRTWLVTCPKQWHHYACDTSNSCDRTCTGWIVALSAAPSA